MTISILLVASAPDWIGTARFPKALHGAGFSVTLLAPPNALAATSRFVDRVVSFPPQLSVYDWVYSLADAVRLAAPRMLVPCDDLTVRLLHSIVVAAPPDLKADVQLELAALIRESLGDPVFYERSVDKLQLPPLAASLGVRIIPWIPALDYSDVTSFAGAHGYPVVLKAPNSAGGVGVAICRDASQAANAYERLRLHREQDIPDASRIVVVQQYVPGETIGRPAVGWNGRELAGITREFVVKNPPETGPGSVVRFYCEPEARIFSDALVRGMGMRGFFAAQFIVHSETRELYLLEISRRITPGHHSGSPVGVDLCAALHAELSGSASNAPQDLPPGFERIVPQFPQEWLRDPGSAFLSDYPVDAPWDDPELFTAMIGMRKNLLC